jgi:hypothetical protein
MPEHQINEHENTSSELKKTIIEEARKGVFNHNPLLSTTHVVTCPKCQFRQPIIYLDYLQSGAFKFGKSEQIEVLNTQGSIGFWEMEKMTPVIISLVCEKCGYLIEVRPTSLEYIRVILEKPVTSGTLYV